MSPPVAARARLLGRRRRGNEFGTRPAVMEAVEERLPRSQTGRRLKGRRRRLAARQHLTENAHNPFHGFSQSRTGPRTFDSIGPRAL